MRRIALWFLTTVSTLVLLLGYRTSTSSTMPTTAAPTDPSTGAATTAPSTATPSTATPSTSTYTGALTGTTADTRWGPVQVRITVASGHLSAVDVVRYPTGNGKDREINADAIPTLVQETLQAQNADIDMVSGATVTSTGYLQSLQSALDQAGIA